MKQIEQWVQQKNQLPWLLASFDEPTLGDMFLLSAAFFTFKLYLGETLGAIDQATPTIFNNR
jgi:hypothetical protein